MSIDLSFILKREKNESNLLSRQVFCCWKYIFYIIHFPLHCFCCVKLVYLTSCPPVTQRVKPWNSSVWVVWENGSFFLSFEGSFLCQRSLAIDIEMKMWRIKIIYSVIILGFGLIFLVKWRHFKYEFFNQFFFKITQRLIFVDGYELTQ